MRTTIEDYKKRCDMELIQKSKYDINARIDIILADIQKQLQKYEDESKAMYETSIGGEKD